MQRSGSDKLKKNDGDQADWTVRAKGNSVGSRFFIWIISRMGLIPAYVFLFFACIQYVLFDAKAKSAIKVFRGHLGVTTSSIDLFRHFYSFGMALIDRFFFLLSSKNHFRYTSINEEYIVRELAAGNGVILLGAHIGNWEIAGNLLQDRIKSKVNFLMYDAESDAMKRVMKKVAEKRDVNIIFVRPDAPDSMVEVINALRRGEVVCLHGDRILGSMRNEKIPFLGEQASFPLGAFAISSISGAPVIPFFAVKEGFGHYIFSAAEPIHIEHGDRSTRNLRIKKSLERYVAILETMAGKYPCQWYNFFDFWKEQGSVTK